MEIENESETQIVFRVSEKEKNLLKERAKKNDLNISQFIRKKTFGENSDIHFFENGVNGNLEIKMTCRVPVSSAVLNTSRMTPTFPFVIIMTCKRVPVARPRAQAVVNFTGSTTSASIMISCSASAAAARSPSVKSKANGSGSFPRVSWPPRNVTA